MAARQLAQSFAATCAADTELLFAVDRDDPSADDYVLENASPAGAASGVWFAGTDVATVDSHSMGEALRAAVQLVLEEDPIPFAIGFCGDDHRPRTHGWDKAYLDALREMGTGIVYGNDLLQGENIPTQVAMTSDIVRALGYMAPPSLTHLYVDNFWKVLGNGADCLRYLPDVIVEHLHPVAGKAEWDEGYKRVNSRAMYERDAAAFDEWLSTSMLSDVAKVRAL